MKTIYLITTCIILLIIFSHCKKELPLVEKLPSEELKLSDDFMYNTINKTSVKIKASSPSNEPLSGVLINVYSQDPGDIIETEKSHLLLISGLTNANGVFESTINIPNYIETVFISPHYLGLENKVEVGINGHTIDYEFGSFSGKSEFPANLNERNLNAITYNTLGSWNSIGIPNYMEPDTDDLDASFLADINASLPENSPLPESHPQYLSEGAEANLVINELADVWVTFVHEGAGYKNVLGFYSYQMENPPNSVDEINHTIIFPNVSYFNSGGGLHSGDKVHIGQFPAGTVIGWFVIANGWRNNTVGNGNGIYYSNPAFNPESDPLLKRHNVLLHDSERNRILLGFEDLNREGSCDNDFNDAVFFTSSNPVSAIEIVDLQPIDSPLDTDNDGVSNVFDKYPNDPNKAINNFYPGVETFGSLAFEDLWPSKGDYDFNDLVIDYRFKQITNGQNQVIEIESKFVLRASGASFQNGFGFQMNIPHSAIASVEGCNYTETYISNNGNGTESSQSKATIIVFDNGRQILHVTNTDPNQSFVIPDTLTISIILNNPTSIQDLGTAPFNPFIIVNLERGKEVHLPGYAPTDLVNHEYFSTYDDNTNVSAGKYYVSNGNLPWAMNTPVSFIYPKERANISNGHLVFDHWAESSGFSYMDWYLPVNGYRDNSKLYIP